MKKIPFLFISLLGLHSTLTAETKLPNPASNIASYNLALKFDASKQGIYIIIENTSPYDLEMRKDALPSSLFIRGIKIFAFEESEESDELKRLPVYLPIGSNSSTVIIPSGKKLEAVIALNNFMKNYCDILKNKPILIFWNYASVAGDFEEYILLPQDGVFRIKESDVECK